MWEAEAVAVGAAQDADLPILRRKAHLWGVSLPRQVTAASLRDRLLLFLRTRVAGGISRDGGGDAVAECGAVGPLNGAAPAGTTAEVLPRASNAASGRVAGAASRGAVGGVAASPGRRASLPVGWQAGGASGPRLALPAAADVHAAGDAQRVARRRQGRAARTNGVAGPYAAAAGSRARQQQQRGGDGEGSGAFANGEGVAVGAVGTSARVQAPLQHADLASPCGMSLEQAALLLQLVARQNSHHTASSSSRGEQQPQHLAESQKLVFLGLPVAAGTSPGAVEQMLQHFCSTMMGLPVTPRVHFVRGAQAPWVGRPRTTVVAAFSVPEGRAILAAKRLLPRGCWVSIDVARSRQARAVGHAVRMLRRAATPSSVPPAGQPLAWWGQGGRLAGAVGPPPPPPPPRREAQLPAQPAPTRHAVAGPVPRV